MVATVMIALPTIDASGQDLKARITCAAMLPAYPQTDYMLDRSLRDAKPRDRLFA
jgi:hypothetical protein